MKKTLPSVLLSFALILTGCISTVEEENQGSEHDPTPSEPIYKDFENVFFFFFFLIYVVLSHILY